MKYYERTSDESKYIYLKKQGEPFVGDLIYQIEASLNFHRSAEFIFVTEGKVHYTVNGEKGTVSKGEILYVDSMFPHSYKTEEGVDGYILVLSEFFFSFYRQQYQRKTFPALMLDKAKNAPVLEFMENFHKNPGDTDYDVFNNANLLLAMLSKAYPPKERKNEKTKELVYNILNYVEEHYQENISLADIAAELGYVKQYCSKMFNKAMGEGFRKYLNRVRVMKFTDMIQKSGNKRQETVLKMATDCGFDSMSTFYRAYKEVYGVSPKFK
ncbi:MAG: AraC family transcriptional regulator [Clostridia bacterium]|nr:AraC family transcriptional regulator [Clostridia bacterium]